MTTATLASVLDAALQYAEAGWPVFPLNGKQPEGRAVAHGLNDATTDAATIRRWWSRFPKAGVGIAIPDGVLVVDVDVRNGGNDTLYELERAHGELPDTAEAETGGGGLHIWLRSPIARNTTSELGPGLDTKARGGYVVAPPSPHPSGGTYVWRPGLSLLNASVADAPQWLVERLSSANGKQRASAEPIPDVIPNGKRNATLTSIAGSMRRRGASQPAILAALVEENRLRCVPPLDDDEVEKIAASVGAYVPAENLSTVVDTPEPHRRKLVLITDVELETRPKPEQIVDDVLLARSTAAIVGPPGAGKGFVVHDLVHSVGCGMEWHGHATKQGACVYIALERQDGQGARVRAWKRHHHVTGSTNVRFSLQTFSLFEPAGAAAVLEALSEIGGPVRIVVVDTTAKAMLPGDENSARDMGMLMANLQAIASTGPTVIGVHHLNASETRERGSTAFRGDVDTLIQIKPTESHLELVCVKQNELAPFKPIQLQIEPVEDSAVVMPFDRCGSLLRTYLTEGQREILRAAHIAALNGSVSASAWLQTAARPHRTFHDARKLLEANGYVTSQKAGRTVLYTVTPKGLRHCTAS